MALRGLRLRPIQPHAKANFKIAEQFDSGLPLALSQGQAIMKLSNFTKFIKFLRLGPGLSQATPAKFSKSLKL